MKLKLDENLDEKLRDRIGAAGHDVSTVRGQGLGGVTDDVLFETCCDEERALVSLDLDFASVLRFPPERSAGLVVLRVRSPLLSLVREVVDTFVEALAEERDLSGRLWIVEPGRVRIHSPTDD